MVLFDSRTQHRVLPVKKGVRKSIVGWTVGPRWKQIMAEIMAEKEILFQERYNSGTTWTKNDFFEKNGYLVIKNLWDADELYHPCPKERGQYNWWGRGAHQFTHTEVESQVEGSLARYWHPQYRLSLIHI